MATQPSDVDPRRIDTPWPRHQSQTSPRVDDNLSLVTRRRLCSRNACNGVSVATLTYVYADQTAVLGPLATQAEPHAYDLCDVHAQRLSAPRGWEVIRLARDVEDPGPSQDDLLALADAVREAGRPRPASEPVGHAVEVGRRGHLRVLRSTPD